MDFFLLSCDRASLMYSSTNNQQAATLYSILIAVNALHVSGGFSSHHQELKTVHTPDAVCTV
jgi:hypothetical protein